MTFEGRRSRRAGLAGVFGGFVFALLASSGPSQSVHAALLQNEGPIPKPGDEIRRIGSSECKVCHSEPDPSAKEAYQNTKGFEFIRLWENEIWSRLDLHSKAFDNLTTSLSKDAKAAVNPIADRMEQNFRKLPGRENYTIASDVACLACHATTQKPTSAVPPSKWDVQSFNTREGVGCEMCHGHGNAYQQKHRQPMDAVKPAAGEPIQVVPWRTWDPKSKADWGLENLRDPAAAAAKCASCHIGNRDEGRFVTHEMYAVGHPPLPPLDLMAYSREQPRHWGLPSQMPYLVGLAKKDEKKAFALFHYRSEEVESSVARRFAESTISTLKATAALTKQLANEAKPKNDGLDFAAFDCYSCHHDLKYPSDRQARGYEGPPGRPQFRVAHFALARLVVDDEELGKQLDAAQKQLAFSFGNRTYGDPELIAKAIDQLEKWCAAAQAKVEALRFTPEETKKLLARIVAAASRESPRPVGDPELAQLYVWAATTLSLDLEKDKAVPPAIAQLRTTLDPTVVTRLRPGLKFDFEAKLGEKVDDALKPVSERIKPRMTVFNAFEGKVFREAFQKLK